MGNCCQNNSTKEDEFEVEVIQQSSFKAQGNNISAQLNSSRNTQNKINADDSQNNHVLTSLANEEIKESGMQDKLDSIDGNGYEYENDYQGKYQEQENKQQNPQNSIKNKFNLKIDLNRINNEISFSQGSEQDEPLMRRRKSSSENVHTQSQPDSSRVQQQQSNSNYQQNQSSQFNNHNNQNGSYHSNQNKLYIDDIDQYETYQGPPVPKKQLNIKLDLEKINEQNENEEYNPNSLQRKN